ncbi:MAG: translational GTPase TypA, partial [Planctomycetota bacterium]|nr:translational GTPase TypA [Planctomycetota bacterium]
IDTPGHADVGGEVERVLRLADGCLLLVDAFEGPMPQTRFVLSKALEEGLRPVVVVNKCDRPDARPHEVVSEVFDLLVELGADDVALDFPVVYSSARNGWATNDPDHPGADMRPVFEAIINGVPAAKGDPDAPLQILITTLAYSEYVGRIGVGRVFNGRVRQGQPVALLKRDGDRADSRVNQLQRFSGLGRVDAETVYAGDLCALIGVEDIDIGDTVADPMNPKALPPVTVDEPTITMMFRVNTSPFAGKEGDYVTSRQLRARLDIELEHNVALRVEQGAAADEFAVSGRGLLHLGVLLETMRREGYELAVGKPRVITKEIDGVLHEPLEKVVVDVPEWAVGSVMELIGSRKGELKHMDSRGATTRLEFTVPSRGLIGVRSRLLTSTRGEGVLHHVFDRYTPWFGDMGGRNAGVLIATDPGQVTAYAVEGLADRGVLFVEPGDKVYTGQVVGEHNRDNDLPVNIVRAKKLDNMRAASKDATVTLKAPRRLSLEAALEYIEDDELVEITPSSIRLRKKLLDENERRRAIRAAASAVGV